MPKRPYRPKIVLIGAGNVGFHLGSVLAEKGHHIVQVFSRTKKKANRLAKMISSKAVNKLDQIIPYADWYILAVSDQAIVDVASKLHPKIQKQALVVHTSGATPGKVLQPYFPHYGNFYPLQTFSIAKPADFHSIPICIYANRQPSRNKLTQVAKELSSKVYTIDDQQRAILHVAAVFVNNFTNHIFHVGESILEKENIPFDLLKPLIQETVAKIQEHSAQSMQTGPAIRGDENTIQQHLEYLNKHPAFKTLYMLLTQSIQKTNR